MPLYPPVLIRRCLYDGQIFFEWVGKSLAYVRGKNPAIVHVFFAKNGVEYEKLCYLDGNLCPID